MVWSADWKHTTLTQHKVTVLPSPPYKFKTFHNNIHHRERSDAISLLNDGTNYLLRLLCRFASRKDEWCITANLGCGKFLDLSTERAQTVPKARGNIKLVARKNPSSRVKRRDLAFPISPDLEGKFRHRERSDAISLFNDGTNYLIRLLRRFAPRKDE